MVWYVRDTGNASKFVFEISFLEKKIRNAAPQYRDETIKRMKLNFDFYDQQMR